MDLKFIHFSRVATGAADYRHCNGGLSESELDRVWRESFVGGHEIFYIRLNYFSWRREPECNTIGTINTIRNASGKEEIVVFFCSLKDLEDFKSSGICKRNVWEF